MTMTRWWWLWLTCYQAVKEQVYDHRHRAASSRLALSAVARAQLTSLSVISLTDRSEHKADPSTGQQDTATAAM
jgi:hypothetical protein